MDNYKCTISYCNKELSKRDTISIKDTSSATRLDTLISADGTFTITPDTIAVLDVENPHSESKSYKVYVVIDKDGTKYSTGSEAFYRSLSDIAEEMGDEEFSIVVYKRESKNYKGKYFITCTIA